MSNVMQMPLPATGAPHHPRTDTAPRNTRVQGPDAGVRREAAFSTVMGGVLKDAVQGDAEQRNSREKADDGATTAPATAGFVADQNSPLPVPAVLAPSTAATPPDADNPAADHAAAAAAAGTDPATVATPVPVAAQGGTAVRPGSVGPAGGLVQALAADGKAVAATAPAPGPAMAEARQHPAATHSANTAGEAAASLAVPAPGPAAPMGATADQQTHQRAPFPAGAAAVPGGQPVPGQSQPAAAQPAAIPPGTATVPAVFTHPGRLTPQLADPLFTLATAAPGEHVMTLKVSPENLGPLTVRAHIDAAGVRIELFAPGDAGRDAVRTILPELRRGLAESGLGAQLNLSQHNTPQDPGAGNQRAGQHGEPGQQRGPGQQSQPGLTAPERPDAGRRRAGPAVVLSATMAGALDVLA
ncbi:flagellar hook-length control protein FliK [Pseudarthrobacter enclensis]|uniref:flagellar hook-length control protein FliK n=1 Tax=Pseudarthrobacter enclensis TaxID=993070 RepID=UPI00342FBC36